MPPNNQATVNQKAAVSVSEMAKMVGLSRARFYDLVQRGVFVSPVYSLSNRRPFYTAQMQQKNLEVRQTQRGVNGEFALFYLKQPSGPNRTSRGQSSNGQTNRIDELLQGVRALGARSATTAQIEQALAVCYPEGIGQVDGTDVLRQVYRHLRRSGVV